MYRHVDRPFLCTVVGCDRVTLGNRFPRHWNLRVHLRRVHNNTTTPKSTKFSMSRKRKAVDEEAPKHGNKSEVTHSRLSSLDSHDLVVMVLKLLKVSRTFTRFKNQGS